jgi:hypothetical protein
VNLDIIITDSNPERVARFQAVFDGHPHLKAARIRPNEFFKIPGLDAIYMSTVAAERWGAKPIMHEAQVLPTSPEDRLENWPAHIVAGVAIKTEEKGNSKFELELIVESPFLDSLRIAGSPEVNRTQRMIRELLNGSGECAQNLPEAFGIAIVKERFDFEMRTLPHRNGADKQASPFCR